MSLPAHIKFVETEGRTANRIKPELNPLRLELQAQRASLNDDYSCL